MFLILSVFVDFINFYLFVSKIYKLSGISQEIKGTKTLTLFKSLIDKKDIWL